MEKSAKQGIEEVFKRHVHTVYRLCYSYFKNAADAEDATQSVFMKLVDYPRNFKDTEHEKAWLLHVAANHCKDVLKSAPRTRTQMLDTADTGNAALIDESATYAPSDVLEAVYALPETHKECVYLHYYEGYSTNEIAQITEANPSTVRNRLADARKKLKAALEA